MNIQDPSQGVHEQLLPHVHLLSTHRYAAHSRLDVQKVVEWLYAAPKLAQHTAPFLWTFVDTPGDGQIFLTWQPLNRLGTEFASDGYVWAGPEVVFTQDAGNGYMLEIYIQKAGFKPMAENFTMHSRRRFRLVPAVNRPPQNNSINPQPDQSLWIVQYGPSEHNDRIPVQSIPVDARTQSIMNMRTQLQRSGQIMRKEFMLADRLNWPQIPLPRLYATPHGPRPPVPQSMAYPPHSAGPPSSKRGARGPHPGQPHHPQHPQQPHPMTGQMGPMIDYDEDEDTQRGDIFDHMSPRDVSLARYEQNHEWMEELFTSPYRIGQILMADLGLGLKGELGALTDGIFEAQGGNAVAEIPKKPYVGTLDQGLADEFRKRVSDKIDATTAEIKRMEAEHERAMAEFEAGRLINRAERELRTSVSETGPEFWRLEGRSDGHHDGSGAAGGSGRHHWGRGGSGKSIDDIAAEVEEALGRKAVEVQQVHRVQDGGYQEPVVEPPRIEPVAAPQSQQLQPDAAGAMMSRHPSQAGSQASGVMVGDSDIDMGGTAAGLLDQMHTGFSSTSTPVNSFPTPQPQLSAIPSAAVTPANAGLPSPHPPPPQPQQQPHPTISEDVEMGNTPGACAGSSSGIKETTPPTAPDQGTGSGDWVVVPKSAVSGAPSPGVAAAVASPASFAAAANTPSALLGGPSPSSNDPAKLPQASGQTPKPGSSALTPGGFSSLGDIEGAGDALAGFGDTPVGGAVGDDGLDLGLVDDSAFGDAFHGVSESAGAGGDESMGGVGDVNLRGGSGTPHGAEGL